MRLLDRRAFLHMRCVLAVLLLAAVNELTSLAQDVETRPKIGLASVGACWVHTAGLSSKSLPRYLALRGGGQKRGGRKQKRRIEKQQAMQETAAIALGVTTLGSAGESGAPQACSDVRLWGPNGPGGVKRREELLAELAERQKCSALDPASYNVEVCFTLIAQKHDSRRCERSDETSSIPRGQDASLSNYIEWTRHQKTTDQDVGITGKRLPRPCLLGDKKIAADLIRCEACRVHGG